MLGTAARYRGRYAEARQLYDEALAWPRPADLWWPAALAQANLGTLAGLEGRHAEALERHERAVAIAHEGGDAWMVATCLMNAAGAPSGTLGDLDRASALQAEALRTLRRARERLGHRGLRRRVRRAWPPIAGTTSGAARLYGAEEAIRERARIALVADDPRRARGRHAGDGVRARRGRLGARRAQGRALTQDEAIAEARWRSPPSQTG